jgi:periplasmic protein CpxP/Spy
MKQWVGLILLAACTVPGAAPTGAPAPAQAVPAQYPGQQYGQPYPGQQYPGQPPAGPPNVMAELDARINALHHQLGVTPAQELLFDGFANVMRANAREMQSVFEQQSRLNDQTAVGRLRLYLQISAAYTDGLRRLLGAFQPLYQSLSPSQRQAADAAFQTLQMGPQPGSE